MCACAPSLVETTKGNAVLQNARSATRLPAQDLDRARRFYSEKLGIDPADERPGGLLYRCASGEFALYQSAGASPGTFTQMGFEVDDIEATVATLKARGVVFEEVDLPGMKTVDGIAEIEGNYPIKNATGERGAWFHDSEGNLLGVGQLTP
jgi:catechol 2,3-dioxygenase-like lactoylglutathione lyase family enzyme